MEWVFVTNKIKRIVTKKNSLNKLEIASGEKPKEGYLHFDIRRIPQVDVVGDAKKLPFKSNSFQEVYSRFFLEHLPRNDAIISLKEMHRVLKKKGKVELIVPNLKFFSKLFCCGNSQEREWALKKIYGFDRFKEDHHLFGYDFLEMKRALIEAGFIRIKQLFDLDEQYLHVEAFKK